MLICTNLNQADPETDEVYAQMTLQPVTKVCQLEKLQQVKLRSPGSMFTPIYLSF